jgi:hypothetical protein
MSDPRATSSNGADGDGSPLPVSSRQYGLSASTLSRTDAATIKRAKKARGVEQSKAVRVAFEAFGLDHRNQDHWDILLGTLKSARPEKKLGRPQKWTEAELTKFNERIAAAGYGPLCNVRRFFFPDELRSVIEALEAHAGVSEAVDIACSDFAKLLEETRSRLQLPPAERLAFLKGFMNELMKAAQAWAAQYDPNPPPELWVATMPPRFWAVIVRFAEEELTALAAAEALYVEPLPARMVAKNLKSTGDYQHISERSLMKYVLSGPVRTRGRDGK